MSDRTEALLEAIDQRLDIIEAKLDALVGHLPQEDFNALQDTIRHLNDMAWERRMGEDL